MADMKIRELEQGDIHNGFLTSLDSLRRASNLEEAANQIFQKIDSDENHIVIVAEMDGKIVGCATILVEQKFIHNGGRTAHIEDVAVDNKHRNAGIGSRLVRYALELADTRGCYKTVLDCTDGLQPFYEKLGFRHNANAMRFDHDR